MGSSVGKLKRVRVTPKKSILHKGKEVFRTVADAREAQKVMAAFFPQKNDYAMVELAAANNTTKKDLAEFFGISEPAFTKHFDDHFTRGKLRSNLRTTQTLFNMANGHDGLYDNKKRRWIVRPKGPDVTALIWWDKTRGGWREGTDVNVKGKGLAPVTQVVVYLPANGREAGAAGDPTFVFRQAPQVIDATKVTEKSRKKEAVR